MYVTLSWQKCHIIKKVFIRVIHLNCYNIENKAISSPICKWLIILLCLYSWWISFLNYSNSWHNRDIYEMLIWILNLVISRSINIVMYCYNGNLKGSWVIWSKFISIVYFLFFFFEFTFYLSFLKIGGL